MVKRPVTLLLGDEAVIRDEHVREIADRLFPDESSRKLNFDSFAAGETPLMEIIGRAQTRPFLAEKRLIFLKGLDRLADEDKKTLVGHLREPAVFAVWVVAVDNPQVVQRGPLHDLMGFARVVRATTPAGEGEIKLWLRRRLEARGKSMDGPAMDLLLERVGKNCSLLDLRLEQLVVYAGDCPRLTREDVEALIGDSAQASAFELYEALAEARYTDALRILFRLKGEGVHPLEILGALVWRWDRDMRLRNMLDRGLGPGEVCRELRIPDYYRDRALRRARSISPERAERELGAMLVCDRMVKAGELDASLALDRCVLELAGGLGQEV